MLLPEPTATLPVRAAVPANNAVVLPSYTLSLALRPNMVMGLGVMLAVRPVGWVRL